MIDLSDIDANRTPRNNGDQSFTFLGAVSLEEAMAFGAGALWVFDAGGRTVLRGLDDDDNKTDFMVWINDGPLLTAADYIASDFIL